MTGIPDLVIRADIMGQVLDPLLCVFLAGIQSVGIGACMQCVFGIQSRHVYRMGSLKRTLWWVRSSLFPSVCVSECLHACVCVVYRADLYTVLGL